MPIRVYTGTRGLIQAVASFKKNWRHYLREAVGLAIFMISACFFGAALESAQGWLHLRIPDSSYRLVLMGILMGATALFIFYSPLTSPSGSHINPAVTCAFLYLGRMCRWDALFYIIFQCLGGIAAVYIMQWLLGNSLTDAPVRSVVTVPGKYGTSAAAAVEFCIALVTMSMVLFTSAHNFLRRYTRIIAAVLVSLYVIFAGPVSGFGMNPARSIASALPAHVYTACWIYILMPFAGMLGAAFIFNVYVTATSRAESIPTHN